MTTKQKEQISALRAKGEGYGAIAASLNLSKNTVKSYCRRNNISVLGDEPAGEDMRCKQCNQIIVHLHSKRPKTFCNEKCRFAWWNANRNNPSYQATCVHCGTNFNTRGNKSRKYCSHPCYITRRFGEGALANDHDKRAV